MMTFAEPLFLGLTLAALPMLWLRRKAQNALGHSQVDTHNRLRRLPIIGWIPSLLFLLAWTALCVALARPLLPQENVKESIQTRDFVVATDISGSMWTPITDPAQQTLAGGQPGTPGTTTGAPPTVNRIDVAQASIKSFVERRKGDRVALLVFDDDTYYHWPLTTDLKIILRKSQLLNKRQGGGTNFDGPSEWSPGTGPLQAGINHFQEMGKAKTKVLVMVTDGESNISPQRFEELATQMEALGVHIYLLGIGESWTKGGSPMTADLTRFVDRLHGVVIPVGDAAQMRAAFDKIDQLEKSTVTLERSVSFKEIYQWFLALSVALWLLYLTATAIIRENA